MSANDRPERRNAVLTVLAWGWVLAVIVLYLIQFRDILPALLGLLR